jgi:hypothetical protein
VQTYVSWPEAKLIIGRNTLIASMDLFSAVLNSFGQGLVPYLVTICLMFFPYYRVYFSALIESLCMTRVEIDGRDPLHRSVIQYITSTPALIKHWTVYVAETDKSRKGTAFPKFKLLPGFSPQWLFGHGIRIERVFDTDKREHERLIFRNFGSSSKQINAFIEAATDYDVQSHLSDIKIQTAEKGSFIQKYSSKWIWREEIYRRGRDMSTVCLDEGIKEMVQTDLELYLDPKTEGRYHRRGIPYHRGYLFYGVPRTGKTTLALALSTQYNMPIKIVTLNDKTLDDVLLGKIFSSIPPGCILLLEDIDAMGQNRAVRERSKPVRGQDKDSDDDDDDDVQNGGVSLSGLLNAIDGVGSPEGYLLIMTTNNISALDVALLGPGRVDLKVEFTAATKYQARNLFTTMYFNFDKNKLEPLAEQFSEPLRSLAKTPAEIQNFLLLYPDPELACENIGKLLGGESSLVKGRDREEGDREEGR